MSKSSESYVGIDLGTTNSAICTFDGSVTRILKSPEQNDVTPSAVYIDRRGNKYIGKRAYDSAPHSPDNAATLFKRLMGTSTPIHFPAVDITKTPEECSSEVLKVLFGYLDEDVRNDPDIGTVITVPAAFNQMQKDATLHAANLAGIGKVALMQEPVAAVMSAVRSRSSDGMFLIFDLGGGTLDVAIAENIGGHINLLAHGGIAMCGGRDFDRVLFDSIVRPWFRENFNLNDDFSVDKKFKHLQRLAVWATERAKIELSSKEESVICLSETEARCKDLDGNDIYLDAILTRDAFDRVILDRLNDAIAEARATLAKAGLEPQDLERIVFVGGPTNYKPLRDKVSFELGIPGSTDVNPMTAVAEGASLFAESIDWGSVNRSRKGARGSISSGGNLDISFNYIARTPSSKAKIAVKVAGQASLGTEFQVDSLDTGWTSGRYPLRDGETVDLALTKNGENSFKIFVFDAAGGPVALEQDRVVITKTAATVDAIPASHSVGIEVLERIGGRPVLDYLVRAGDALPYKGKRIFKAAESLKAGATGSLNLKLWEGEIEDPITDNRPIGVLKISGSDFDDGAIPAGADLECEYEMLDSGNIVLEVSVPCIGGTFHSGKNFYSRQEGQLDYTAVADLVAREGTRTLQKIDEISAVINDPKLDLARGKLSAAVSLDGTQGETDDAQESMENVLEARRLVAAVRKEHLKEIRQIELDSVVEFFVEHVKERARPTEITAFENLSRVTQRAIEKNDNDFEHHIDELRGKNFEILWRQDWFVISRFKRLVGMPHAFVDHHRFDELSAAGNDCIQRDDMDQLRSVVAQLSAIEIGGGSDENLDDVANIIKG